jgi:CBS domain-containing protein
MPFHEIMDMEEEEYMKQGDATTFGAAALTEPIRTLNLHPPVKVSRDTSVGEAAQRMVDGKVGCVLVEEGEQLVGIFTERDLLTKVLPQRLDPDETPVAAVMTRDPETLSPDAKIAYVLNEMTVGGFRVDLFPTEVLNLPPDQGLNIARTQEGA